MKVFVIVGVDLLGKAILPHLLDQLRHVEVDIIEETEHEVMESKLHESLKAFDLLDIHPPLKLQIVPKPIPKYQSPLDSMQKNSRRYQSRQDRHTARRRG